MIISVSVSFTFEHDIIHPVTLGKSVTHPLTAPVIAHYTHKLELLVNQFSQAMLSFLLMHHCTGDMIFKGFPNLRLLIGFWDLTKLA